MRPYVEGDLPSPCQEFTNKFCLSKIFFTDCVTPFPLALTIMNEPDSSANPPHSYEILESDTIN